MSAPARPHHPRPETVSAGRRRGFFLACSSLLMVMLPAGSPPPARGQENAPVPPVPPPVVTTTPGPLPAATAADLFAKLAAFSPLPKSELQREIRHTFWTNRVRLALNFGALVGDGLLVVQGRDRDRVPPLARELLRRARSLGVGPVLVAQSQNLAELAEAGRWEEVRVGLIGAQGNVEAGLTALRDDDLAMFVRLGGWLRGVECAGAATAGRYTAARAAAMARPEVLRQFLERLEHLKPALRENLVLELTAGLREILGVLDKAPTETVSAADARRVYDVAARLNAAVAAPDDA